MRHLTGCHRLVNAPAVGRDTEKGRGAHVPRGCCVPDNLQSALTASAAASWNTERTFYAFISPTDFLSEGFLALARITNQTQI